MLQLNNVKDSEQNIIIKPQVSISWKQYKVLYNNN